MVQEVTTRSWGSRLGGAFFGILVGIALIIGSFILIFWNESHGLHTAQSLQQTEQALISIADTPINEQNNLKAVYFTGEASTNETLKDPLLGVSVQAIKLNRKVEMYQWRQKEESKTETQFGGSEKTVTTYTYNPEWSETLIDSNNFKEPTGHQNPASMPFKSTSHQAQKVTVGDFDLPKDLIDKMTNETPIDLSKIDTGEIEGKTKLKVQANADSLYLGNDPQTPNIGDMRISASQVQPQIVSVIAQQTGNTLQPYIPSAGKPVALLVSGQVSANEMIHQAEAQNRLMTWILRAVSLLLMIFGISLLLNPLVVLADIIPFVGKIVGFGTGLVAFIGGLMLWAIATALAWFIVRPLFAIGLIILVVVICYFIIQRRRRSTMPIK